MQEKRVVQDGTRLENHGGLCRCSHPIAKVVI